MFFLNAGVSLESVVQLLTMIVIFIFILVLAYFTSRFAGSIQQRQMQKSNIKVIETVRISNTKYLQIISAGGKYILIAVCKDSVTYLCELDEDKLNIPETESSITGDEFRKVFAKFKNSSKVEKDEEEN